MGRKRSDSCSAEFKKKKKKKSRCTAGFRMRHMIMSCRRINTVCCAVIWSTSCSTRARDAGRRESSIYKPQLTITSARRRSLSLSCKIKLSLSPLPSFIVSLTISADLFSIRLNLRPRAVTIGWETAVVWR